MPYSHISLVGASVSSSVLGVGAVMCFGGQRGMKPLLPALGLGLCPALSASTASQWRWALLHLGLGGTVGCSFFGSLRY